ncbi:hypothetical protein KL86CLO1_12685 [uncultured Eubacteriales bacterium]|uniref:Uncharacterized protein n=1 Tax=uncultured Eubacteriales bacterium TaxID=172733 RepID=A0A212KD17_9FIRM|nr:hypothetical protein KL86CLO1_12685 [uncultured Eubacteriales bacterium]
MKFYCSIFVHYNFKSPGPQIKLGIYGMLSKEQHPNTGKINSVSECCSWKIPQPGPENSPNEGVVNLLEIPYNI